MEVILDYKKTILDWNEKKVVREKLKTFYLNFTKNKKIIQISVYAGLLINNYLIWRGLTFSSKFWRHR